MMGVERENPMLPNAIEAEEALLGSILLDPAALNVARHLAHVGFHSTNPAQSAARLVSEQLAEPAEPAQRLTPEQAREKLKQLAPSWANLRDLLSQEYPPTLWVVPDLLPEGLTLLAAKPKLGKSWMALGLALAVASGGLALGQTRVEPGAVLYLALEDSPKRLKHRTAQLLGSTTAPERLTLATDSPRLDQGGLAQIELWLQATPGARLVILDTLAKLRGQARSGTLYSDDYASLEAVQRLAHRYSVGILVIHHTGKESRDDALDEVNATQGLNGVADNILVLRRERGKTEATLLGDGRELNGVELSLQFDTATGAWSIAEPKPEPLAKTPEREEIVRYLLATGRPAGPTEVAGALGKNVSTVRNEMVSMARSGELERVGHGLYRPARRSITPIDFIDSSQQEEEEETVSSRLLLSDSSSERTKSIKSMKSMGAQGTAPHEEPTFVPPASLPGDRPQEPTVPSATTDRLEAGATSEPAPVPPPFQAAHRPQEPLAPGLLPNPGQQPMPYLQASDLSVLETLLLQPERYFTEEAVVRCAARLLWRRDPKNRDEAQPFLEKWLARFGLAPTEQWEDWLDMEHQALYYEQAIIREARRL